MLDLGFLPDVVNLISKTPETRQTMLFSATMPAAIVSLARVHMRHPMNIRAESSYENATVPATAQFIYQAHDLDKPEIIGRILQAEGADKMIVFTRTKRQSQRIAEDLAERGFRASPLHGDMAQVAREKAMARFREDKIQVLVCTDVAARGIDVRGVSHVVNYTCPEDDKTYIHRIGRTGRAGASGIAITFVDWADLHRWKMINKALDLPFDEPQETYSTSEHLFHDQGIAPGTKGRIVDPAPPAPRAERPERRALLLRPAGAQPQPQPQPDPLRPAGRGRGRATARARPRRAAARPPARARLRWRGATGGGAANRRPATRRSPLARPAPSWPPSAQLAAPARAARPLSELDASRSRAASPRRQSRRRLPLRRRRPSSRAARTPTSPSRPPDAAGCSRGRWACRARRRSGRAHRRSIGMSWKPIAAPESPWVKRTNQRIVPESSMPTALEERE